MLNNQDIEPDLLFALGQATAIIVEPKSAATNATKPVGTGPYQLEHVAKGLLDHPGALGDGYRNSRAPQHRRATFRFIPTRLRKSPRCWPATWTPCRVSSRAACAVQGRPALPGLVSGSRAKTILAIEQRAQAAGRCARAPRDCRRHRPQGRHRGAADGCGVPIGSHYVPGAFGYVDTTGVNPYDLDKAKKLLGEAGVKPR